MRTQCMNPSGMGNVLGVCDPVPVVQRNFDLAAAAFGAPLQPVFGPGVDLEPEEAVVVIQGNFAALEAATGIMLYSVVSGQNPEVCCQANFELLNAAW